MSISERDKWTVYAPAICTCIDARAGTIQSINGGIKHVFILEFIIHDTEQVVTKFYNVNKTKKGNYALTHDGDFAMIYRLVTGNYNKARYSRAQQLLKHMVGVDYRVEYGAAESRKNKPYLKATKVSPVDPAVSEEWFTSGKLKPKKRRGNTRIVTNKVVATEKQQVSNDLAIDKQKHGNKLTMIKAEKPHSYSDSSAIPIPLKHTTLKHNHVEPYTHTSVVANKSKENKYKTKVTIIGEREKSYRYYPRPDESEEQYHERVIDESGILELRSEDQVLLN